MKTKVAIIIKCKGTKKLKELTEGVIKNFENHETVIIYCCSLFNYRKVKKIKEKRIYPNYEYVEIVFKKEKRAKGYSC